MITPPRSLITCDICGAAWEGTEGDDCYWCDKAYQLKRDNQRHRLLWPEFMGWGERFERCKPIDRAVWAQTRGFVGDYEGKWKRELFRAVPELLSDHEVVEALIRHREWTIHTEKSANY